MSLSPTQNPRKSLKTGSEGGMNVDKISHLPDNVVDQILSYLPIKDAAKTSALSSEWRYKWETVPSLVLTHGSLPPPKDDQGVFVIDKLVRNIERILYHHSGPLRKFELSYPTLSIPADEIDYWIRRVLRHSMKGFTFAISIREDYKIPSSMFSCQNLAHLSLTKCLVKPPSAFKGFKNLIVLRLYSVSVAQDELEFFVSSSPVLKLLHLSEIKGLRQLNISAPSLQRLYVLGNSFVDIRLKNTLRLLALYINTKERINNIQNAYHGDYGNFVKVLADMPRIRKLYITSSFVECFARGNIPRELPVRCFHLDFLSVNINLASPRETSVLVCLLRSVPNLQTMQIYLMDQETRETGSQVWEADHWNCPFTRLLCVRIEYLNAPKARMDFVKFVLATTPVLERLVFSLGRLGGVEMKFETVKQLCGFKRLSPIAEVIFE